MHLTVPQLFATGARWPAPHVEAIAGAWRRELDHRVGDIVPVAAVTPSSAEGLATLIAVTARQPCAVLLRDDPRVWPAHAEPFTGMPLVLPPQMSALSTEAERRGFRPIVLDAPSLSLSHLLEPLSGPGIVVFTSGSTGEPKPVFRPMSHVIAAATARVAVLGLRTGEGVIDGTPLASGHGIIQLAMTMVLGGAYGMLDAVDYRAALAALAHPAFACWRPSVHLAEALSRCDLQGPPVVPRVCVISTPVSRALFDRFAARFGVPLRQSYSSSETGPVAIDGGPADSVVPGTVGHPLTGVEVRIGDHPESQVDSGVAGSIWVRSAWQMAGYGVPPHLARPGEVDGFWPTRDVGALDASGRLTLQGRTDDNVRTREGRLVNLESVAAALRELDAVRQAVVLPLGGAAGVSFGVVIEGAPGETIHSIRDRLTETLEVWARPRRLVVVDELPRLPSGKPDRLACLALLGGAPVSA